MNNRSLCQVDQSVVEADLSPKAYQEIARLFRHLAKPAGADTWIDLKPASAADMHFRYTSSVIVRSELQVYGVSTPRFAFRLEIDGAKGFINLRRLKLLATVLHDRYGPPGAFFPFPENETDPKQDKVPVEALDIINGASVADCLLPLPQRFSKWDMHHVSAELATHFGETDPAEENYRATPYVRTAQFGVGLCAQACCFISTLLLVKYATHVCGLGEIGARVQAPNAGYVNVAGLPESKMMEYFASVHLSCIWQVIEDDRGTLATNDNYFEECLHGYAISNMPLILGVNFNRLPDKNIPPEADHPPDELAYHAITLVGCSRWNHLCPASPEGGHLPRRETIFLYNDSSCMPFADASNRELARSGMPNKKRPDLPTHPNVFSVTPLEVSIPLLNWKAHRDDTPSRGLLQASQIGFDGNRVLHRDRREFLLAPLNSILRHRLIRNFPRNEIDEVGNCLNELINGAHENLGWDDHGSRWVWFETGVPTTGTLLPVIKIWDAQAPAGYLSDRDHGPNEVLKATLAKDPNGIWKWEWNRA